jgi:hypothetical protein
LEELSVKSETYADEPELSVEELKERLGQDLADLRRIVNQVADESKRSEALQLVELIERLLL